MSASSAAHGDGSKPDRKSSAKSQKKGQSLTKPKQSQNPATQSSASSSKTRHKENKPQGRSSVAASTSGAHEEKKPTIDEKDTVEQPDEAEDPKPTPISAAERAQARQRYKEKLQAFATARNAVGANGQPVRSRSELMAARKSKEERRKARRKEVRAQAKEAEREDANAEATRLIGGFGAAAHAGPGAQAPDEPNFTFNHMDTEGDGRKGKKRDAQGALAVAEKRERRLAGFDAAKRAQIEETDAWRAAERRVAGDKVKDDVGLLKRSLKRKDKAKKKSGAAWQKREEGVKAGIRARQAKRTENLKKRRPGFEGTFKIAKRHV